MRISDWSSDVCSSDLLEAVGEALGGRFLGLRFAHHLDDLGERGVGGKARHRDLNRAWTVDCAREDAVLRGHLVRLGCGMRARSEEHTSELQSLMRISYAVFCLKKKRTSHVTLNSQ